MSKHYVDLKINGRLFPLWILHNYKKYKIPDLIRNENEDPCKFKLKDELYSYQNFIAKYLDYKGPYRELLIYHNLGTGKTATAINVYNILYNYTPGWNVFILIKAMLEDDPWISSLKKWLETDEKDIRFNNIKFIHYDSPFADKSFINAVKQVDSSKNTLYIIDEIHNFINNVYSNINTRVGKKAHVIYDYIMQDKKENDTVRILLLSATPVINHPFELSLIFNLLRPGIFPLNEAKFNDLYISPGGYKVLNPSSKNMFQRRIMGLTSYYTGATEGKFATQNTIFKNIPMSPYQQEVYDTFEELEKKMDRKRKGKKKANSTYKAYTRQSCNFVFPYIDQHINGETRPRPYQFRISTYEAEKILEGREDLIKEARNQEKLRVVLEYEEAMHKFINATGRYFDKKMEDDKQKGYTLNDEIDEFKNEYKMKLKEFMNKKKKSSLLESMISCSSKMTAICLYLFRSKGPAIVYSNYVKMEGLEILKMYLRLFGYTNYNDGYNNNYSQYIEFHGGIKDKRQRQANRKIFNDPKNIKGELVKVMLISPIGSEGMNLKNVRQVHIMEPYWHEIRIHQLIGRAIRLCSHKDLPMNERHVDVYRYKSIKPTGEWTTDEEIEDIAKTKDNLISSFLLPIKEVAVDCELNKSHNMQSDPYKCFKFDEPSLFDTFIGPAYKEDVYYDSKIDNGLNSLNSIVKRIKVIKIKAVEKHGETEFSSPTEYWYSKDSGVIYDLDLDYPVGKIYADKNGIPNKLNKDTYIIDYKIPIPKIDI